MSSSVAGSVTNHSSLSGLSNDDHKQYLLLSGSRAMTGTFDLGTNSIVNCVDINGFNISSRASVMRLMVLIRCQLVKIRNYEVSDSISLGGISNNLIARADHVHSHGNRGGGSLHALVTIQ